MGHETGAAPTARPAGPATYQSVAPTKASLMHLYSVRKLYEESRLEEVKAEACCWQGFQIAVLVLGILALVGSRWIDTDGNLSAYDGRGSRFPAVVRAGLWEICYHNPWDVYQSRQALVAGQPTGRDGDPVQESPAAVLLTGPDGGLASEYRAWYGDRSVCTTDEGSLYGDIWNVDYRPMLSAAQAFAIMAVGFTGILMCSVAMNTETLGEPRPDRPAPPGSTPPRPAPAPPSPLLPPPAARSHVEGAPDGLEAHQLALAQPPGRVLLDPPGHLRRPRPPRPV